MMAEADFSNVIRSIRERPRTDLYGPWFNLIRFRDLGFLQGQLWSEDTPAGVYRPIAALADPLEPLDIDGFWPSVTACPVERDEEARLVAFLSARGPNDVELVVPERNTSRSMDWGRFDEAPEYPVYRSRIHPAVIEAVEEIRGRWEARPERLCVLSRSNPDRSSGMPFDRILDVGCGCGDLIQGLQEGIRRREALWERSGCADLQRIRRPRLARVLDCHGIDVNPDNIEEAGRRGIPNVRVGEGEDAAGPPGEAPFDILIFCGLLNRQVTTREQAQAILRRTLPRLSRSGHIVITGYTSCHLAADDLVRHGLTVLRKSFPNRLFLDYSNYHLRQLYVARKDT